MKTIAYLLVACLALAADAHASHFRFGSISWRPTAQANTVAFTVQQAWRRDAFGAGSAPDGLLAVGDVVRSDTPLEFGDGQSAPVDLLVTAISVTDNWFVGSTATPINHTYAGPNDSGTPWVAFYESCCRISTLRNNADGAFRGETLVDLAAGPHPPNTSPVTTGAPIRAVPQLPPQPRMFLVPAVDANGDPLSWRLSTSDEASGSPGGFVQPTGLSINPTSGKVTWDTSAIAAGLWNVSVTVSDGTASVPIDFIVNVGGTESQPPDFDVPPTPPNGADLPQLGLDFTFTVRASDPDAGDVVSITPLSLPPGATFSNPSGTNPVSRVFSWNPDPSDNTPVIVCFIATDDNGSSSDQHCVTLHPGNPCAGDGVAGNACDDGNPCTTGDVCTAQGTCAGQPVVCAALDGCHLPGVCEPETGCSNPPAPDGTPCTDGDLCNGRETCQSGLCVLPTQEAYAACSQKEETALISNFDDGTLSFLDPTSGGVSDVLPVGKTPWAVAVAPDGATAWTTNRMAGTVTLVDLVSRTVVTTVPVGGLPLGAAVHPDGTRLYVANYDDDDVSVIDTASRTVVDTIKPVGRGPAGLAFNLGGTRLFVANYGDDTVAVVDTATNTLLRTIPAGREPHGMSLDRTRARLYVANYAGDDVSVLGIFSGRLLATVKVGSKPFGVVARGPLSRVFVTNAASDTVSVLDAGIASVLNTIAVERAPLGLDLDFLGARLLVANASHDNVSLIDTATDTVALTAPVGKLPVAFGPFTVIPPTCGAPAPVCDDGDPFTTDSCVPATGCAHVELDGIAAAAAGLDALGWTLTSSSVDALGGGRSSQRLNALVDGARRDLGLTQGGDAAVAPGKRGLRRRQRKAARRLRRFDRAVKRGIHKRAIGSDTGFALLDLSGATRIALGFSDVQASKGKGRIVPRALGSRRPLPPLSLRTRDGEPIL